MAGDASHTAGDAGHTAGDASHTTGDAPATPQLRFTPQLLKSFWKLLPNSVLQPRMPGNSPISGKSAIYETKLKMKTLGPQTFILGFVSDLGPAICNLQSAIYQTKLKTKTLGPQTFILGFVSALGPTICNL